MPNLLLGLDNPASCRWGSGGLQHPRYAPDVEHTPEPFLRDAIIDSELRRKTDNERIVRLNHKLTCAIGIGKVG